MILGLLGDIHGNARALDSILSSAKSLSVERLLVTGDLVGYYFEPLRVLQLLQDWKRDTVRGNHEEMLRAVRADNTQLAAITARYGSGLQLALAQLSDEELDELCELPHPKALNIDGCRILLCHGSPWDIDQYVYPDAPEKSLARCATSEFDLVVMGHTHYPLSCRIGETLIANPGSVGQPRNRNPRAHWALFDTSTGIFEQRYEPYDAESLAQECRTRHPELPYISDVLLRT